MHTLGTIRGTHVRLSSLRSQRVVGRGAPRGMTKLRYEVVAIFGPTASGKSEVAQALADRIGTEVVSADALQVYRGLPILTNQPARSDASRRHPRRLRDDVRRRVRNARPRRDRRPRGDQRGAPSSQAGRVCTSARRSSTWTSRRQLRPRLAPVSNASTTRIRTRRTTRLRELDPAASEAVHRNDRRRVVRALELAEGGASLVPSEDRLWSTHLRRPTLVVGLDVPPEELERRIAARTAAMVEHGVADEVRAVVRSPVSATAGKALGLARARDPPGREGARSASP